MKNPQALYHIKGGLDNAVYCAEQFHFPTERVTLNSQIATIVRDGKGSAGSGGAWRVERHADRTCNHASLFHHGTRMLTWDMDNPSNPDVLSYETGWGSVSGQGGMNRAFRALNLNLYYTRAGGAHIA